MVIVKEAIALPKINDQNLTDATVRLFLLPKVSFMEKRKTACIKNSLNPRWNESFEYKYVSIEELKANRVLELTVWDFDKRGCNDFIGSVRLGSKPAGVDKHRKVWMNSNNKEVTHWAKMLSRPGEWVEGWHELQPSIGKRFSEVADDLQKSEKSRPSLAVISRRGALYHSHSHESNDSHSPVADAGVGNLHKSKEIHQSAVAAEIGGTKKLTNSHPSLAAAEVGGMKKSKSMEIHLSVAAAEVDNVKKSKEINASVVASEIGDVKKSKDSHSSVAVAEVDDVKMSKKINASSVVATEIGDQKKSKDSQPSLSPVNGAAGDLKKFKGANLSTTAAKIEHLIVATGNSLFRSQISIESKNEDPNEVL